FQSTPSNVGASADHRWPLRPSQIEAVARLIATRLGADSTAESALDLNDAVKEAVGHIIADLEAHRGNSLVIPGDHQPPVVHALCHAINAALGNVGATVRYIEPVEAKPEVQIDSLRELVRDL